MAPDRRDYTFRPSSSHVSRFQYVSNMFLFIHKYRRYIYSLIYLNISYFQT